VRAGMACDQSSTRLPAVASHAVALLLLLALLLQDHV
jgi:hypothetical protein